MEQLTGLSLGRKLILGAGVLLFIDTFFAWQKVSPLPGVDFTASAWHGFWGVLLGLMTIAILAWVVARAFGVGLPANVPDGLLTLALGALIALFAVLKTLTESYSAWASYVGIVLAVGVAAGAWMTFQESGESLPRTIKPSSSTSDAETPAETNAPSTTDPL